MSGASAKRLLKRSTVCGVSEISGTSTIAVLPRASATGSPADRSPSCRCRSRRGAGAASRCFRRRRALLRPRQARPPAPRSSVRFVVATNCSSACGSRCTASSRSSTKPRFCQRAQRLIIERSLAQQIRGRESGPPAARRPRAARPARRAARSFSISSASAARAALHEQLLFPADFRAPDHLRQQAAHHRFDRAAVVGRSSSAPARAASRSAPAVSPTSASIGRMPGGVALFENRDDRRERRFVAKRHAHARADVRSGRRRLSGIA